MTPLKKRAPLRPGSSAISNIVHINDQINTTDSKVRQADCAILLSLWEKQQSGTYFLILIAIKNGDEAWTDQKPKWFTREQFGDVQAYVGQVDLDKYNVYATPCGFKSKARGKTDADESVLAFADLDPSDPRKLTGVLRPTIAIESSPGSFVGVWVCDEVVPPELNQRLTYATGADKGGHASNKLLRLIPGTKNHKYPEKPRVELLWDDSPTCAPISVAALEAELPKLPSATRPARHDAAKSTELKKRTGPRSTAEQHALESKLQGYGVSGGDCVAVITGRAHDRSKAMYSIANTMLENSASRGFVYDVLMASPLNEKYAERSDGGEGHMNGMLDKIEAELLAKPVAEESDVSELEYEFGKTTMDQVEEEVYDWVWKPFLARGEMTPLDGLPEAGKSFLAQMISTWVCDGETNTPNKNPVKQSHVLYFDFENNKNKSTKVRLRNMGCKNMDRFHIEDARFTIGDAKAMKAVEVACELIKPDLVVFDTLNRYLPAGTKNDDAIEMTHAQDDFVDIARKFNCAVLVLRHLNKSENQSANNRVMGTVSNRGVSRLGIAAAQYADDDHPYDEEHRGMMSNKFNDGPGSSMITYRIVSADQPGPGKLVWGKVVEGVNLDELYARTWAKVKQAEARADDNDDGDGRKRKASPKRDEAKVFIRDFCSKPQFKETVVRMAADEGIAESTLTEAYAELKAAGKIELIRHFGNEKGRPKEKWFAPKPVLMQLARDLVKKHQATSKTEALLDEAKECEIDVVYIERALPLKSLSKPKERTPQ